MTTYVFDVDTSGNWSDESLWFNQSSGVINDGTPGAGDTADIYASDGDTTIVTTAGQSVGSIEESGAGTATLSGAGLSVSGNMTGITLLGGDYSVAGFAGDVTLLKGTLSGNAIGGTTSSAGGADIKGGMVTNSASFRGTVSGGATVQTADLIAGSSQGSGTINATTTSSDCFISENGGLFSMGNVFLGADGGGSVQAGTFDDKGAFSLIGGGSMTFSGGVATVAGATDVGASGILNVGGKGKLTLSKGLTVGEDAMRQATLNVGGLASPGGNLSVKKGAVLLGDQGKATVNVGTGGVINALSSDVIVAKSQGSVSTVTVSNGGKLHAETLYVGKVGKGTLNVKSAGRTTVSGDLTIGASSGSLGAISVTGASSKLTVDGFVDVGGTANVAGGRGSTLTIGSGATATLGNTTIWKETGEIIDTGTLTFSDDVEGASRGGLINPVQLEIGAGGHVNLEGSASRMNIDFGGAGNLRLDDPSEFTAKIRGISSGGSITVAAFQGATEYFAANANGGTVYLLDSTILPIHFVGSYKSGDFYWNAATATLQFV